MVPLEIIDELCEMVESGEKLKESARIISRNYGFSVAVLTKWYYRRKPKSEHHGNQCLSEDQEEELLFAVLTVSLANMDWSVIQLRSAVKSMFGVEISIATAYRFSKKHRASLNFEETMPLGKNRSSSDLYKKALAWVNEYKRFLA